MIFENLNVYALVILNALFVGVGSALGNWLSNKLLIRKTEDIVKHIKKKMRRKVK